MRMIFSKKNRGWEMDKLKVKLNAIVCLSNLDDIVKAVGIRRLRDGFKVGRCVSAMYGRLNQTVKLCSDKDDKRASKD